MDEKFDKNLLILQLLLVADILVLLVTAYIWLNNRASIWYSLLRFVSSLPSKSSDAQIQSVFVLKSKGETQKYGMNSVSGDHFVKCHSLAFLSRLFFRVRSGNSIISPLFLLLMIKRCRNWVRGNEMISSGRCGARICWIQVLNFRSSLSLCVWLLLSLHCFVSRHRGLVPSQDRKACAEPYTKEHHFLWLMKDSIPGLWEEATANTFWSVGGL